MNRNRLLGTLALALVVLLLGATIPGAGAPLQGAAQFADDIFIAG